MIISPPYGTQLKAGLGVSTVIADMDFETYSPAGYVWDAKENKWRCPPGTDDKGLAAVGATIYTEHPDAEVLLLAYDLKDGKGPRNWKPLELYNENIYDDSFGHPLDLFDHLAKGFLIEAWNASFEFWVWENICVKKYGFPSLNPRQLRCAMAKARAFALPGKLEKTGEVLKLTHQKDKNGQRLINKFCIPRDPTIKNRTTRILMENDPEDAQAFVQYNIRDIETEAEASSKIPDLLPFELEFWQYDQVINRRGVQIDTEGLNACISIINQVYKKYDVEMSQITNGMVPAGSELPKLKEWLTTQGMPTPSLTKDVVENLLTTQLLPPHIYRAIQLRSFVSSNSVKKVYSIANRLSSQNRLHDLFSYHAARTGRATGNGPQPQNLPKVGPDVSLCECGSYYARSLLSCPWCGC